MTETTAIRIIECTDPLELFTHYDGQSDAQGAYIELDLHDGTLLADYDPEVGGAIPFSVYHGFERRYSIPILTGAAANRVMTEIKQFAERILADWEEEWDGHNMKAVLGEDAQAAEQQIINHLGCDLPPWDGENQGFADGDLVQEWDLDGATNGNEVDDEGITAETTDKELEAIADRIIAELASINGEGGAAVCPELLPHLIELRDEMKQQAEDNED